MELLRSKSHTLAHRPVCSHTLVMSCVSGMRRGQKCTVCFLNCPFFPPGVCAAQVWFSLVCWPIFFLNSVRHDEFFMSSIHEIVLNYHLMTSVWSEDAESPQHPLNSVWPTKLLKTHRYSHFDDQSKLIQQKKWRKPLYSHNNSFTHRKLPRFY